MKFQTVSKAAIVAALLAAGPVLAAPAQNAAAPAPQSAPVPQQQRPNVLVWMMDDVGYAQVSCFGGLVDTPNIDRVARMGLRYTNYHTAPICSAARASFLSGRMPHSVHIGGHATAARDLPGYDAHIPPAAGTVADNLHSAGYTTFAVGKWDHLPSDEATPAGPFNQWPQGQGFDRFYGFLAADTDNWNPTLVRDSLPVARPADPKYHLSADMADQAIAMIGQRGAVSPERPFFMYWATGAAHAPHHAPADWIARYKGKFDMGWDKAREIILKRQIAQGIVPKGTKLAPRPDVIAAWDSLSAEQKKLYAHQMEVFAASLSYADAQFGRILDALEARGELDNTMIVIVSDNGASAEGGLDGLFNEAAVTGSELPGVEGNMRFFDAWGGPRTYPHYAAGWAVAGDTPLRYYKQVAHEGGTRVPLVISWPRGIAARGDVRGQFVHVSDVAPTILEATHVPLAKLVNNVPQSPMEGESVAATFAGAGVPDKARAQYVELYGNKGLWQDGWQIVTTHRYKTWDWNTPKTFDEPWELYNLRKDLGQTTDLAAKDPQRVAMMAETYRQQAERYHVNPQFNLSDTAAESYVKARADFQRRGGKWRYEGPVSNVTQAVAPPVNARGFRFTANVDVPASGATGPLFSYGGQLGGIALYLRDGKPAFLMNDIGGTNVTVASDTPLAPGKHPIDLMVDRRKGAQGQRDSYHVTISADGAVLTERSFDFALPIYFGIPETFGVGSDSGSPVMTGYAPGTPYPGAVRDALFDFTGQAEAGAIGH